jgi:hypothetical protein
MCARPIDEAAAEALRRYRESRHRWLLWGNLASLALGAVLLGASLFVTLVPPERYCNEFDGQLTCSGGVEAVPLTAMVVGLFVLAVSGKVLYQTDGFLHRRYDLESRSQKALYLLAAFSGLPALVAMAVIVAAVRAGLA